jgi:hypothetical protein
VPIPLQKIDRQTWDVSLLPPGLFIAEVKARSGIYRIKLIKK